MLDMLWRFDMCTNSFLGKQDHVIRCATSFPMRGRGQVGLEPRREFWAALFVAWQMLQCGGCVSCFGHVTRMTKGSSLIDATAASDQLT